MSMLRNLPVVYGQRQIGFFQDVCFDQARKRVCALVVACGIRGKKLVPPERIRMISSRFILIDGLEKYRHSDKQETALFVRDITGKLAGRVSDYAIDETTKNVLAIEMLLGYGLSMRSKRIWVYEYAYLDECGELSIPLDLHDWPCSCKGE